MNNLQILNKSGLHSRERNGEGMLNFLSLLEFSFSFDSLRDVSLTCESLEFNLAEEPPLPTPPTQKSHGSCVRAWDVLVRFIMSLQWFLPKRSMHFKS